MELPRLILSITLAGAIAAPLAAHAEYIGNSQGGTDFPQGAISFADAVVSYTPGMVGSSPTEPYRNAASALGVPDYAGSTTCTLAACPYVSLGDGGSIVLRFIDNRLTGSGNTDFDLWVFEVGPDIEDTFVAISKDGIDFHEVGKVFGSTAGIDIDAHGWGIDDIFEFVRLTDDTAEGNQTGITVGADIDALGAITTIPTPPVPSPAPAPLALLALGLAGFAALRRRQ